MESLILRRKTGFRNLSDAPVVIRDFRGKMFYSTEGLRKVVKFNLPEGSYFVQSGKFEMMRKPVKYPLYKLPKAERRLKPPFHFNVVFRPNPNKCTIKWKERLIVYDPTLKDLTLPELWFILYHEYGHSVYGTEKYADLMAANLMLIRGYNPSQIGMAPITSLSAKQIKRKRFMVKNILK